VPVVATLLERLATRGESVRAHTARLLALLDDYGPQELAAAVAEALARDALGPSAITHILETRRRQRRQKPPIPLALPDRPGVRDLTVTPRPLDTNDALARRDPDDTD
jgi:DNA-binding NarL/FixJ family response regulator